MQGGTGGCKPPAMGSGGLEAPRNSKGSGGRRPPSKNIFGDVKIKHLDTAWHGIFMTRHDTQKYGMACKHMAWHGT